jgi:hypothetical protein
VVFRKLENQAEEIREIRRILTERTSDSTVFDDFSPIPKLPVETEPDLSKLHDWAENPDNYTLLVKIANFMLILTLVVYVDNLTFIRQVKYLSQLGGRDLPNVVRKILKKIFSHELSEKINFTGRNGKLSYESMKIRQVIKGK